MKVLRRSTLILLCSALAACAGGDGPDSGGREAAGRGPPRRLPNVFISPAGEPFRAAQGAPYPVGDWFAKTDTNHDGRISREEFRADALRFFDKLDTNHDGIIDGAEVASYEQDVAPEILPRIEGLHAEEGMDPDLTFGDQRNTDNRPDGSRRSRRTANRQPEPPKGIGVQGAAVYSVINTPEPVAAADTQFDGRITRAEFTAAADRRFDMLDTAGAGSLTLAGLPKTPIQLELIKRAKQAQRRHERPDASPPP